MASFAVTRYFFLLTIALFSVSCLSDNLPFVLPIGKDQETNIFYTPVGIGTPRHNFNLAIDLGGPNLWYDCDNRYTSSSYHHLPCDSKTCPIGNGCSGCIGSSIIKPGCTNDTCAAKINNPRLLGIGTFVGNTGRDVLFISDTVIPGLLSGCINSDESSIKPLEGFPKTIKGIFGLARTSLALPAQLSLSHHTPKFFSLCLPSSNTKGLGSLFIGGHPQIDSLNFLNTTRLIINPHSTAPSYAEGEASYEYFIDVKSIKVGGEVLGFKPTSLLAIDNEGNGGTKLSTMTPFTVLHSSIYKPLVRNFIKKAAARKIKKVAAVAPFGACFDLSTIGRTITGLDVPTVELVLAENVVWTIYGGNSMVVVKKNVACLGFVDGGKDVMTSVVIGGSQLQDRLLGFDLASSKLSFSSSLLLHGKRCSHFKA